MAMRYMMHPDQNRRRENHESSRYEMNDRDGRMMSGEEYGGGRYEARRLPPRNRYGEFRRRRREYNEDHDGYGYDEWDSDGTMGRRRYREDDWQTQGFVDPARERRYYNDEYDPERRRERRERREREYYGDDDDYD